jgi:hypothetical protein
MQAFFHRRCSFAGIDGAELVDLHTLQRSVAGDSVVTNKGWQTANFLPCANLGASTFFLKTKKRVRRVGFRFGCVRFSMPSSRFSTRSRFFVLVNL